MKHTLWPRRRRNNQVGKTEAGQYQEALQHLGEKTLRPLRRPTSSSHRHEAADAARIRQ